MRASPPLLVHTPSEEQIREDVCLTAIQKTANYARWFIVMRWIAVVVAAALIFITVRITHMLPTTVWWPLMGAVLLLGIFNVLCAFLLHRQTMLAYLLQLQVYGDLIVLTILLHYSGGIENPLSLIMLLHVIIGGIVLSRPNCYVVAVVATLLFGVLAVLEWGGYVEHYTLAIFPHHMGPHGRELHAAHETLYAASRAVLQGLMLLLTAYFVTGLAERQRHDERRLQAMADWALAERQLLERSLQTTATGLRVIDRELETYWSNDRWQQWFDRPAAEPPEDRPHEDEKSVARQTLADGQVRTIEVSRPLEPIPDETPNDAMSQRMFLVTTAPLLDAGGHVSQVVQLAQDVTEQKRAHIRMMRASQLAAVGELAGQVAHEVNNPIAIISAKARLMISDQREQMSDSVATELAKIIDLSDRVARIAQGLLFYCRPSGATRMPLDIRIPARRALAMIEQRANSTGITVKDQMEDALPMVRANAQEMEQVFLNLYLNALDAMKQNGHLLLSARVENDAVAVTVQDDGPGIPTHLQARIFEPFVTTKQSGKGTGLGLAICQGLIRSHAGRIEVDSSPGRGTRFTVRLPMESSPDEQEPQ
ncbi:hypothetical protein HED60_05765 [Planctomycetales bacterium ZRK34]|nr:hypothetical protein HED60_05765 [Planctomycetales bacterium ZRK34]